jgi:hypothetical protein
MSESNPPVPSRQSVFDRMRGPMTLLLIAVAGFAFYYSLFFERKTSYYRDRNARLVARLADQVRRSIQSTERIVSNAATMPEAELKKLYGYERNVSAEQRQATALFDDLELVQLKPGEDHKARHYATFDKGAMKIVFEGDAKNAEPATAVDLAPPAKAEGPKQYVSASIPLRRVINGIVADTAGEVFDTVFILDHTGNVIYQTVRQTDDESEPDVRIVRIKELRVPRMLEGETTLQVTDLMSASRQMAVRIGDTSYQLSSVPLPSSVVVEQTKEKAEAGASPDLWVMCGLVSTAEFRSRSLALSVTVLSCLAAAFLLTIFAWPFAKMAMTSAQHKVTLADVILVGVSGILAASIVCLIVLDWYTFRKLEATADSQLESLAGDISTNFRAEVATAIRQLDTLQKWAEQQIAAKQAWPRSGDLLAKIKGLERPYFESVSLIGQDGRQAVKWSVDAIATPLTSVGMRSYFSAPAKGGREYLYLGADRIAIQSIRSTNTPRPEAVFARHTRDANYEASPDFVKRFPVIAVAVPDALPIINPVVPRDFGFAIVDASGTVLFHSDSHRNTVENFYAETDDDPRVKAAVEARQMERMNIRYWGEDYRAFVQPMKDLPWTLITFREKRGLRTLNTEALTITLIFLLLLFGAGLLGFVSLVLMVKPRYRARWVWPNPAQVKAYLELCAVYIGLLAIAAVLLLTLRDAALLAFPFWFVPLGIVITYLYLRVRLRGAKRVLVVTIAAALTIALLLIMLRGISGDWSDAATIVAAMLLVGIVVRAVLRPDDVATPDRQRERQTALPLCYTAAAFLLLVVMSVVPATAFFKAAYELQTESHVKWAQMKLARDLESRWWRITWEFTEARGQGKAALAETRRIEERNDIYSNAVYGTNADLKLNPVPRRPENARAAAFPFVLDAIVPRYSEASVKTRELVHDRAADDLWWWNREGSRIDLVMQNPQPRQPFRISSIVPPLLPSLRNTTAREAASVLRPASLAGLAFALLVILGVAFAIARFIARRIFLVDLVNPLWLSQGFLGLNHVLCYPCDSSAAKRVFEHSLRIDLADPAGLELARTAPQSFEQFEPSVFIDNLDYEFATGEGSKLVRDLIERLTRNGDRVVVLRPVAMNVITASFLQNDDRDAWAKTLSTFVWVNGSQLLSTEKRLSVTGPVPVFRDDAAPTDRWGLQWLRGLYMLSGFDAYFEQFTDTKRAIDRTLARETAADPYLATLMTGLGSYASGREQLLDEISERAEQYYSALWRTCAPNEQVVLMQIAQTGLVNGKTRKDVRRLLARGLLRRDPQLRLMNETFRRFVSAQCSTSALAQQLEQNLAGDAWNRVRVPFFAAIAVVLLFFFTTQRQTFDATIALLGGLAASLPAFLKTVSGFGQRGGAKAG